MKKSLKNVLGTALLATALLTSCSSDDDASGPNSSFVLNANDFKGDINDGNIVLDAGTTYKLTGRLTVQAGATLTIPAGTRIEGTTGTSYIAVAQDGKIYVNGTASNPVVMTSAQAASGQGAPGQWGGLVICGRAPINKGATASAEVSELTYG